MKRKLKTIDCTPTWISLIRVMLQLWEEKPDQHENLLPEFIKMAKAADRWIAHVNGIIQKDDYDPNNRGQNIPG